MQKSYCSCPVLVERCAWSMCGAFARVRDKFMVVAAANIFSHECFTRAAYGLLPDSRCTRRITTQYVTCLGCGTFFPFLKTARFL